MKAPRFALFPDLVKVKVPGTFTLNGDWVIVLGDDNALYEWDIRDGSRSQIRRVDMKDGRYTAPYYPKVLEITPDGQYIIGGGDNLFVWRAKDLADVAMTDLYFGKSAAGVKSIDLWQNGETLLAALGTCRSLELWKIQTGGPDPELPANNVYEFLNPRPSGRTMTPAEANKMMASRQHRTERNPATLLQTFKAPGQLTAHTEGIHTVKFSPDHRLLLSASGQKLQALSIYHVDRTLQKKNPDAGDLRLWDLETRRLLVVYGYLGSAVWDAHFTPDGRSIIAGYKDGTVKVWLVPTAVQVAAIKRLPVETPVSVAAPAATTLADAPVPDVPSSATPR